MAAGQEQQARTAAAMPPAGPTGGVKLQSIDASSNEIKQLVRQLNKFATATSIQDHAAALQNFDEDMTLDTPFIQVQGRDRVRILSAFSKYFLGNFEIEPRLVKISVPEGAAAKGGKVELDGIVHWMPHRPWWLLTSYLLPRDVPIYADVSMGVKAHNDKVFFVSGKNHNLPHVPRILRVLAGYVAGTGAAVAEPAWNALKDWYGSAADAVAHPAEGLRDAVSSAQHAVSDAVSNVQHSAQGVAKKAT